MRQQIFIALLICTFGLGCVATVDVPGSIYGIEQADGDKAVLDVNLGPVKTYVSAKVYGWNVVSGWVGAAIDTVVDIVEGLREVSPTEG